VLNSFLFLHSPLVGPSSLRRVADLARSEGITVALPDLTSMAGADRPHEEYTRKSIEAATEIASPVVVVGHSGAGAFLPSIGARIDQLAGLVFVDAVVPPRSVPHETSDDMKLMLDQHTDDGILHRWLDWWPPAVVAEILPDAGDREELVADMPRVPRAFYDFGVAVPEGWSEQACGYVQLSDAYEAEYVEAIDRGWPAMRLDSTHLGTHTDSARVFGAILQILDQIGQ